MREVNFCPHCGSQTNTFVILADDVFFCKTCEGFFELDQPLLSCPKCKCSHIRTSDYPALDGSGVFLCQRCFTHVKGSELIIKS